MALGAPVLLALGAACSDPAGPPPAARTTAEPSDADAGTLVIRRVQPEGPIAVEGSAAYARLVSGEHEVFEEAFDLPDDQGPLSREVPAGAYELVSYQRACDPSACSEGGPNTWGPPRVRCSAQVTIPPGTRVTATVRVTSDGCTITTGG